MGTPIKKELGPGYDYPNRKFHLLAVILPTVLIIALAIILVRREGAPSSRLMHPRGRLPDADVPAARVHGSGQPDAGGQSDAGGQEDVQFVGRPLSRPGAKRHRPDA
jgi:hypothetical protein